MIEVIAECNESTFSVTIGCETNEKVPVVINEKFIEQFLESDGGVFIKMASGTNIYTASITYAELKGLLVDKIPIEKKHA